MILYRSCSGAPTEVIPLKKRPSDSSVRALADDGESQKSEENKTF